MGKGTSTLLEPSSAELLNRRKFLQHSCNSAAWLSAAAALGGSPLLNGCTRTNHGEPILRIGYVPITDATPMLIAHAQGFFEEEGVKVETPVLMRGFTDLSEAFLSGLFDLVHLLFPIPVYMRFSQKHPIKVVAWNHMNGSALTVNPLSGIKKLEDIGGKRIAIPSWYSMHNVILQLCLRQFGIEPVMRGREAQPGLSETNLIVMKAPDMPPALSSRTIDGFIVAEPYNASAELLAHANIVRFTGDVFKNHPCCVAVMKEDDIVQRPEWVQRVVNAIVKAQAWIIKNREQTARILSKEGRGYLPFPENLILRAMTKYDLHDYGLKTGTGAIRHPEWGVDRISFQPYPFESATREIVGLLKQTKVEGGADFLKDLNPEQVVHELFAYNFVKEAADKLGGLSIFEGIDPKNQFTRTEIIKV